jgi:RNA polymerase sigma factor (sigma-70 family)
MADAAAFEAFFRANLARVVRACTVVTVEPSIAEDIAAEAFARLWAHWDRIENEEHAIGYVFKTSMRLCSRSRRLRIRERGFRTPPVALETAEPQTDEHEDLVRAIRALPLRQRQVVALRDWAGFSTNDVATMLSVRDNTVRVHLARAHAALRVTLREREQE